MSVKVLIAHAKGEESEAEKLAGPIRSEGYEVAHEGTVMVGESVIAEVSKLAGRGLRGCKTIPTGKTCRTSPVCRRPTGCPS